MSNENLAQTQKVQTQGQEAQTQTQEAQRAELLQRCNEVIGVNHILSEVLSFFPDKAALFIETQEHASKIEGRRGIWYAAQHKERGYGLTGNEIYEKGQFEHLGVKGYTGEGLLKSVGEINRLRGEGEMGKLPYFQSSERVFGILEVAGQSEDGMEEWDRMHKKVLEVMGVTDEELALMREYAESYREADSMRAQADLLKRKADEVSKQARERVEAKYPRKSE